MLQEWTNRIVFILACAGIFIALFIGVSHAAGVRLPCGPGEITGCDQVQDDVWSSIAGVPTAFLGLALYIGVAAAAFARAVLGPQNSPRLGYAIWALLASGTVVSGLLLGHAHFNIQAQCHWCVASGVVMLSALVVQSAGMVGAVAAPVSRLPWFAYAVLMLVTLGAGGGFSYWNIQQDRAAVGGGPQGDMDVPFFRDEDLVIGNPDAPITIVEYADLYCPTCREMHAWLENRMEGDLKDRVRLVVRHFPLHTQHPKAVMTAMFAEWATEKGKGAEFVNRAFLLPEDADEEELFDLIGQIGLDPDEARLLLEHEALQDPYLFRVQQDMADGREFGVQSTPHWIIVYPDGRASWAVGEGLKYQLDSKKFRRYLQSLGR